MKKISVLKAMPILAVAVITMVSCKKEDENTAVYKAPTSKKATTEGALIGTTYYVDTAGSDSNPGTSSTAPWKTIAKVNTQTFSPGDQVLFKAGETWSGNLKPLGSGAAGSPIVINMYGSGNKPIINGGGLANGSITLYLYNLSYWEVNNLEITNKAAAGLNYSLSGIKVNNPNTAAATHIYIKNCYVHDVNSTVVGTPNYNKDAGAIIFDGFINDVLVRSCHVYNCQIEGIRTTSSSLASNVVIDSNLVETVYGDGIVLHGVTAGKITHNTVHNACISNAANFAGVWTYLSNQTIVSNNEVYGLVGGDVDGQAFDADISTNGDIYEYNYSHDNYRGFMLFMPSAKNIVVRYNISANDVKGGLKLFNFTATDTSNKLYNNVFYLTNNVTYIFETKFIGTFQNNIINSSGTVTDFSQNTMGLNARFINNCIYPNTVILANNWNGCYHLNNIFASPQFTSPSSYGIGRSTATAFSLKSTSPCIAGGLAIPNNGGYDFFGTALSTTTNPDAGAIKY